MHTRRRHAALAAWVTLFGSAAPAQGADDLADRALKGDFDATGVIACAQSGREAFGRCEVGIFRGDGRSAVAVVVFPNGFRRTLSFEDGMFLRANPTMSGTGTDTQSRLEVGIHSIRVEGQRYTLPDTLVFGD
ncbi:hypothetical protein ILP92_11340 [Maribius pontilimi]|uniref:Uncharacterized protein n=1 Tax=Palleronia pontilimi TaxID=1964209 RepID=A0A934MHI2_9RHOB|nr:hypothetical protein [Palleronia pontilimi]MBJ3763339.1 hypothetical protein [Palleronia pontilimi]